MRILHNGLNALVTYLSVLRMQAGLGSTSFFFALCLLTIYPAPSSFYSQQLSPEDKARSLIYYSVVGLLIALPLSVLALVAGLVFPTALLAALLLLVWVVLSGALHLDGLADCCDGFFVHHKGSHKTLAVMKEPHIGAMAAVGLVLVLLIKFSALLCLSAAMGEMILAIVTACVSARLAAAHYMLCTPYASPAGMVSGLDFSPFTKPVAITSGLGLALLLSSSGLAFTAVFLICVVVVTLMWRQLWLKRIGGYTGDCVGALIEIVECLSLTVFVGFM